MGSNLFIGKIMESITETINNLIIRTSGGILFIWLAILLYSTKILKWCGKKIAEGANNDLVKKLMPSIAEYVENTIETFKKETVNKIEKVSLELEEMKKFFNAYRDTKHNIETENKYLKQAIKDNDEELLKVIHNFLNEKK